MKSELISSSITHFLEALKTELYFPPILLSISFQRYYAYHIHSICKMTLHDITFFRFTTVDCSKWQMVTKRERQSTRMLVRAARSR